MQVDIQALSHVAAIALAVIKSGLEKGPQPLSRSVPILTMIRAAEYQVQTTQDQNTLGNAKGSASSFARKGLSSGDHCGGSANAEKNARQEMSHHVLKDTCCWQKFTHRASMNE